MPGPRCLIVIPAYGDDPRRRRNLDAVVRHLWSGGFDEQTVKVAPPQGRTMAHARNGGLEHARGYCDVVVFNDADSLVDPLRITEAVELAADGNGVVFAYDLYVRLSMDGTALYHADRGQVELERLPIEGEPMFAPPSIGCVAVSARLCPLFHTGFTGWGYEDLEWLDRCAGELGPHRRLGGPLYHLWHGDRRADDSPADSDPELVRRNLAIWQSATLDRQLKSHD